MALIRASEGYRRYAFSVQYNGTPFLGFAYQGLGENCITVQGNDFRGIYSVQGKLRIAFNTLLGGKVEDGQEQFENMQVSSRTDRGVHAWKNTFHADIKRDWQGTQFVKGLNFHLRRHARAQVGKSYKKSQQGAYGIPKSDVSRALLYSTENDIYVTNCLPAPLKQIENKHYQEGEDSLPQFIDWNARFTATSRTYVYRIITNHNGMPFQANFAWIIKNKRGNECFINTMRMAATFLLGKHDFTSFRAKGCSRLSPFVTIESIEINSRPLYPWFCGVINDSSESNHADSISDCQLITIKIRGDSFLYRQVRNMVGCLVAVGQGQIQPKEVQEILHERNRDHAPKMAPAYGLILANVEHGEFRI